MTGSPGQPEMTADDVCAFLDLMDSCGVRIWLDGGWAVDACLGSQTRPHDDLDIVIEQRDMPVSVAALEQRGYAPVPRPDTRAWNFVLGDDAGHQIDFHVIVFDEHGRGVYGPASNEESYPAEALTGTGTVNGRTVVCITPEWLVRFHTGYEVDASDRADVSALCERFGIPVPGEYRREGGDGQLSPALAVRTSIGPGYLNQR
jgi:lincosamide nucleotidyltransferase A/C/D/E